MKRKLSDQLLENAVVHEDDMRMHLEDDDFEKAKFSEAARNRAFDAALEAEREGE